MHEQQPTQEAEHTQVEKWHAPLTRPSFFSKHFAVVIFIILPFIGFYLGALYAYQHVTPTSPITMQPSDPLDPLDPSEPLPSDPVTPVDDTSATQAGIQSVVEANNQFAFDVYEELNKTETGNIFYSPYSISTALAMTYEGAKGQTASEMQSVFHFPESSILRPNIAAIYNDINSGSAEYELKTGNALWAQYDYAFLQDYTDRVEQYYGGKVTNLDFVNETEASRQTINTYIEQQTNDKIKNLIPKGVLGALTRLVLTNAIYFKGTWEWEFEKSKTYDEDFYITSTNSVQTPMMHMSPEKARFNYADLDDVQVLELPYKGNKLSMLIVLPKEELADITLTTETIAEYKLQMQETDMDSITLPKFEFDSKYFMADTLTALGMPTAFSSNADFSGMDGTRDLFISEVIHQAYVKVDEEGTEAAAATAVVMNEIAMSMPTNIFRANHPFLFTIQDNETGNILFMGRVTDPTQ